MTSCNFDRPPGSEVLVTGSTGLGRACGPESESSMARNRLRATLAGPLVGLTALALGLAACGTDSNSGGGGGGSSISIWEGWTGAEAKTFTHLVAEYQKENPGQKVSSLYVNN